METAKPQSIIKRILVGRFSVLQYQATAILLRVVISAGDHSPLAATPYWSEVPSMKSAIRSGSLEKKLFPVRGLTETNDSMTPKWWTAARSTTIITKLYEKSTIE